MPAKDRKLILVRRELLDEAISITAKEGKTLFAFTNEIFEQALKAYEMHTTLAEILEFYALAKLEKDAGAIVVPASVLDAMVKRLWELDKEELVEKWYDSGRWFGQYLSIKFPNEDILQKFEKTMKNLSGMTDFSLAFTQENTSVTCVSLNFTPETTECLSRFIEGVMHSLRYRSFRRLCLKGLIQLDFRENGQKSGETLAT